MARPARFQNQLIDYSKLIEQASEAPPYRIFVGYPYTLDKLQNYRDHYKVLGGTFNVNFIFADQDYTGKILVQQIAEQISECHISLFDVSMWNPNVLVELGFAIGINQKTFLLYNNAYSPGVPFASDLVAARRFEYTTTEDLSREVAKILIQCGVREPDYVVRSVIRQICRSDWTPPSATVDQWKKEFEEARLTVKDLVRKVGKNRDIWKTWLDSPDYLNLSRQFYLRFLAREPESEGVRNGRAVEIEKNGFEKNVDDFVDSPEYNNRFGQDIVPF